MNSKLAGLIMACLLLITPGCHKKSVGLVAGGGGGGGLARATLTDTLAPAAAPQRFIAEHHTLEVIAPEAELQKSWESAIAFCGTIQCEVLVSRITARMANSPPAGTMLVRVAPQDLNKLLDYVQKLGKISRHETEREDKTAQVVDTEAKLENLTTFRDNLRAMLSKPSATVKDLIEIQQQLTETQAQLDSQTALRKVLANETEKVAVEISFRVEQPWGSAGGFAQIWDALRESGSVLGESTASLITVIVAVIPWLILTVPVVWVLRKAWRKLRRNRKISLPPTQPAS